MAFWACWLNKKVRKTAGKMATGAVGLGGAAILGAVAFNAYKNWQGGKEPPTTPSSPVSPPNSPASPPQQAVSVSSVPKISASQIQAFDPVEAVGSDGNPFQVSLIKAMIAAANADGHIDQQEQAAVFDAVGKMELEAGDKALVFDTLQSPPDAAEVASYANGLEQASEIYLVSRMAIAPDHPSEQAYLQRVAALMELPDGLIAHLEAQVNQAQLARA